MARAETANLSADLNRNGLDEHIALIDLGDGLFDLQITEPGRPPVLAVGLIDLRAEANEVTLTHEPGGILRVRVGQANRTGHIVWTGLFQELDIVYADDAYQVVRFYASEERTDWSTIDDKLYRSDCDYLVDFFGHEVRIRFGRSRRRWEVPLVPLDIRLWGTNDTLNITCSLS